MRCDRGQMLLYAVTDRAWTGRQTLAEQAACALRGGVTCLQLREKGLDTDTFLSEALELRALCRRYGVPLIINDNVEIALRCGADGVHVGQGDTPVAEVRRQVGNRMIIGASAHNVDEAVRAVRDGADYLGAGAIFPTGTKGDVTPLPLRTLREICRAVDVPVVAIGGLNGENLGALAGCGIAGAALVSAIFSAPDIEAECRRLRALVRQAVRP
ncbi:MAG TPA: thiamine phosphate synthase [Candidatus Onthomonas avicola]|nr:thiamine phosphate synthase [Candidatus Onthomonas avicola]